MQVQGQLPGHDASLPTELIDQIVSSVHGASLVTCSLISRSWVAPSRRLLFREFTFKGVGTDSYHQKLRALYQFLTDTPYVGAFVKTVTLAYGAQDHLIPHTSPDPIFRVLAKFTYLEALKLRGVCIDFVAASANLSSLSSTLRDLTLRYVFGHKEDTEHISTLLRHLPALDTLRVVGCGNGVREPEELQHSAELERLDLPPSLALERFEITDSHIQAFLDGLSRTATAQRLRYLKLNASAIERCAGDMASIKRFLHAVGPQLEELVWRYHFSDEEHGQEATAGTTPGAEVESLLVPCTALRKLVVRPHFSMWWMRPLSWCQVETMLVGYNTAHCLTELVIAVGSTEDDGTQHSSQAWEDHVGWRNIQGAVRGFKALRVLRFVSEGVDRELWDMMDEELEEEMIPYIKENIEGHLGSGTSLLFKVESSR